MAKYAQKEDSVTGFQFKQIIALRPGAYSRLPFEHPELMLHTLPGVLHVLHWFLEKRTLQARQATEEMALYNCGLHEEGRVASRDMSKRDDRGGNNGRRRRNAKRDYQARKCPDKASLVLGTVHSVPSFLT